MKKESKSRSQNHAPAIDIVIRALMSVFFAFSAGIYFHNALAQWNAADTTHVNAATLSLGFSILSSSLYAMMIACLYVLRKRATNQFFGVWPSIAAVAGSFLMFGLLWLKPNADLPIVWRAAGCCLIIIGNVFAIYALTKLGRSFSILPESRTLVTAGPYKIIRHPLYAAEALANLGAMILFFSTGAVVLVVAQMVLQLFRIRYEEHVLTAAFPEYKQYAQRTFRLIPGIY